MATPTETEGLQSTGQRQRQGKEGRARSRGGSERRSRGIFSSRSPWERRTNQNRVPRSVPRISWLDRGATETRKQLILAPPQAKERTAQEHRVKKHEAKLHEAGGKRATQQVHLSRDVGSRRLMMSACVGMQGAHQKPAQG